MVECPQEVDYESKDCQHRSQMAQCFASKNDASLEKFLMSPKLLALKLYFKTGSKEFLTKVVEGVQLISYNERIVVPTSLRDRIITWYHHCLCHPGQLCMEATLQQLYSWNNMNSTVQGCLKSCKKCQMCKKNRKQYGLLPAKDQRSRSPVGVE